MLTIPPTLAAYRQFILYTISPSVSRPGKTDKFPINSVTGHKHDAHDPTIWLSADEATAAQAARPTAGIGFVFTDNDPLFFLDLDDCLGADGQWSPLATQLCDYLAGCFIEVSLSGSGLHIIGAATAVPPHSCKYKTPDCDVDLYTEARFVALTGTGAYGDPTYNCQQQLDWLCANYFPPTAVTQSADWTSQPDPEWTGPTDDADLIRRMLASKSAGGAFSGRATPQALWTADPELLAIAYPPQSGTNPFDHSSADAALCQHLAFWTGRDCERIDRLFRQSALYRDKWEREGYARDTVLHATSHCRAVYTHTLDSKPLPTVPATEPTPTAPGYEGLRDGVQMLSITSQIDYFKGCVYIRSLHKAFVPDGELLKPEQFKASYGGYTFSLDMCNDKTSRSAWEALTENMGYNFPKAHDACFRPELPPGAIIEEESRVVVNTYVPVITERRPGDPAPFLDYLSKLIPDAGDRAIMLAYVAALVQYPGVKFQWCPLLQGIEGNGKSLLIRVISFCVGNRYSHMPNAKDIDNKFNAWLRGKLFIGVEEIYTADRQDKIDALKPLITNDRVELQGKGDNQVTGDNRANFLMCSNHKDAIRKTLGDRRYCIFFTAQQEPGDIHRDGMGGDYFPDLYDWLREDGYAIVNNYLRSYQIPDLLNPATHCHRAPTTSSTAEAIRSSMGGIEQEVMEAIEEGRPGFAGGWISSTAFDKLLDDRRAGSKIPRSRRRDMLKGLGYDWHPNLPEGRINNPIMEGGQATRPRLYLQLGHPAGGIYTPAEIVRAYQDAQGGATVGGTLASVAFRVGQSA